jgi:hypothetical protein
MAASTASAPPKEQKVPDLLSAALAANEAGLCVMPPREDGTKRPIGEWRRFETVRSTTRDIAGWYRGGRTGLGLITGRVSGSLKAFECDTHDIYERFVETGRAVGLGDLIERIEAGYVEHSPNGVHWLYRCSEIAGNTKLAQREKLSEERRHAKDRRKTLIETRNEGGFIIVAPSHGTVHPSGLPYVAKSGSFATIVTITPEERRSLHDLARTFHAIPEKRPNRGQSTRQQGYRRRSHSAGRIGDDYTAQTTWEDVLTLHGWTVVHEDDGKQYWRKPGKEEGWSATTNHQGLDLFYCFSTATEFESDRYYTRFEAYAVLNHSGDEKAAARALVEQGYGGTVTNDLASAGEPSSFELLDLPEIMTTDRPLREIAAEAWTAFVARNDPPARFVRTRRLVRVATDERGQATIEPLSPAALRGDLTRSADFLVLTGPRKQVEEHVFPPQAVVDDILAWAGWPGIPALAGLVGTPVLRPDGTILDQPGYDPATRLLYQMPPGFDPVPVPERPTSEDVAKALGLVDETIGDFPYANAASRANAVGFMLTLVVRAAIRGPVPMAAIDKADLGTGGSLLADVAAIIATGQAAVMMTSPLREEEWRKELLAVALEGKPITVIDNQDIPLRSGSLASFLTSGRFGGRILGRTARVDAPNQTIWLVSGNNLQIAGDLHRRCYPIRLDARMPQPWTRDPGQFTHHPLKPWVLDHRAELIAALLTLARSWYVAGCPAAAVPTLGSFESWAETIGSILAFVGVAGFLANLPNLNGARHEDGQEWEAFLTAWYQRFGKTTVSSATVAAAIRTDWANQGDLFTTLPSDLAKALEESRETPTGFTMRLGNALAKRNGRHYGDYRLERTGDDSHTKSAEWRVLTAADLRGFADFQEPAPGTGAATEDVPGSADQNTTGEMNGPGSPRSTATPAGAYSQSDHNAAPETDGDEFDDRFADLLDDDPVDSATEDAQPHGDGITIDIMDAPPMSRW